MISNTLDVNTSTVKVDATEILNASLNLLSQQELEASYHAYQVKLRKYFRDDSERCPSEDVPSVSIQRREEEISNMSPYTAEVNPIEAAFDGAVVSASAFHL